MNSVLQALYFCTPFRLLLETSPTDVLPPNLSRLPTQHELSDAGRPTTALASSTAALSHAQRKRHESSKSFFNFGTSTQPAPPPPSQQDVLSTTNESQSMPASPVGALSQSKKSASQADLREKWTVMKSVKELFNELKRQRGATMPVLAIDFIRTIRRENGRSRNLSEESYNV